MLFSGLKSSRKVNEVSTSLPSSSVNGTMHKGPFGFFFSFLASLWSTFTFFLLISLYLPLKLIRVFLSWFKPLSFTIVSFDHRVDSFFKIIDWTRKGQANRTYFIELSLQNLRVKKTRTFVTMGGMAVGIALIVFLVSVGYGLQNLVISRVARLDELKQADVMPGVTEQLRITDETLAQFKSIPNVDQVLPVIGVVGRMSYQNSISDLAVYGVTADYLRNSAVQPVRGTFFESNLLVADTNGMNSTIATAPTPKGGEVSIEIDANTWLRVRSNPSITSSVVGYTRSIGEVVAGLEVIGGAYGQSASSSAQTGRWIQASWPIWTQNKCDPASTVDCESGYTPVLNADGQQKMLEGYVAELSMNVTRADSSNSDQILGVTTRAETGSLPLIQLASESSSVNKPVTKVVQLPKKNRRELVVNRSVLNILGISESEAVGKIVNMTFVIVGELQASQAEKLESAALDYTIVAVIPDEGTPLIYVPFIDLRSLGVERYSQAKVVVSDVSHLARVRGTIEASGFATTSVSDTVKQIDSLFVTFRFVLGALGMVALAVAALGMFNTLTVSLLERTREVGLMKAMGMKSNEVRELFLTESMIMGFFGGIIGLLLGLGMGVILSFVVSFFSLVKGVGYVHLSYVPPMFVFLVLAISVGVGILTGYFPARRATKISALNALRYE